MDVESYLGTETFQEGVAIASKLYPNLPIVVAREVAKHALQVEIDYLADTARSGRIDLWKVGQKDRIEARFSQAYTAVIAKLYRRRRRVRVLHYARRRSAIRTRVCGAVMA